jgi:hypothetical protein
MRSSVPHVLFHHSVHGSAVKAGPLQAWSGPEGSRKLWFPDYVTTAQDGGKVVKPYAPAAFTPQEMLLVLILLEAESTPGP